MAKHHMTPTGPLPCSADKRPCKYGEADHFSTKKEALVEWNRRLEEEHGALATTKKKATPAQASQSEAGASGPVLTPASQAFALREEARVAKMLLVEGEVPMPERLAAGARAALQAAEVLERVSSGDLTQEEALRELGELRTRAQWYQKEAARSLRRARKLQQPGAATFAEMQSGSAAMGRKLDEITRIFKSSMEAGAARGAIPSHGEIPGEFASRRLAAKQLEEGIQREANLLEAQASALQEDANEATSSLEKNTLKGQVEGKRMAASMLRSSLAAGHTGVEIQKEFKDFGEQLAVAEREVNERLSKLPLEELKTPEGMALASSQTVLRARRAALADAYKAHTEVEKKALRVQEPAKVLSPQEARAEATMKRSSRQRHLELKAEAAALKERALKAEGPKSIRLLGESRATSMVAATVRKVEMGELTSEEALQELKQKHASSEETMRWNRADLNKAQRTRKPTEAAQRSRELQENTAVNQALQDAITAYSAYRKDTFESSNL